MLAAIHRTAFRRATRRGPTGGGAPLRQPQCADASVSSAPRSFRNVVGGASTESGSSARTQGGPPCFASGCYSFDQEPVFAVTYYYAHRSFSSSSRSTTKAGSDRVTNEAPEPLILKVTIGDDDSEGASPSSSNSEGDKFSHKPLRVRPLVLMPPSINNTFLVDSVESIVEAVNRHYSSAHFVGGMGEQDPGVWFAPGDTRTRDLLDNATTLQLLQDAMDACRSERHGVPFAVYTSGVNVVDAAAVAALQWDSVQVSLWAATPNDYTQCTGGRNDFGQVCGFIAQASEMNVPVEVGVLRQYAGPATSLALSLGARHVHAYDA